MNEKTTRGHIYEHIPILIHNWQAKIKPSNTNLKFDNLDHEHACNYEL